MEQEKLREKKDALARKSSIPRDRYLTVMDIADELEDLEIQIDAMIAARTMDVDDAEAILRVELGSKVSGMTTKELKRDLLCF